LKFEEKIYNVCSDSIRPVIVPELWKYKINGKDVFCFYILQGFSKPYAILQKGRERYYTRRGTRVQEASRDELLRLFQTSGQIHHETTPVIKGEYADLDFEKISGFFRNNQFNRIDISGWENERIERFLKNKEILVEYQGRLCPTVAGILLFGKKPFSLLGCAGITVSKFTQIERDYNYIDFRIDMPIINAFSKHGEKTGSSLIDEALEKIKFIIFEKSSALLKGSTRIVDYPYPEESIREAIVNAVAHRNYTIMGIDIRVDIYPDRLEIESPGRLPNTISLESIRLGAKYYRNQILVQYLKEAGFMDLHSLGIPVKILKLCAEYTGREPDLYESENSFKVILYPKIKAVIGKVEEQILKLLRASAEPMKAREIGDAIGLSKRTAINWINRLIDKNLIESTFKNRNDPKCGYRAR
jgi:ATP-dependent DNA helicase RecG